MFGAFEKIELTSFETARDGMAELASNSPIYQMN
jgi:hypothetical protein